MTGDSSSALFFVRAPAERVGVALARLARLDQQLISACERPELAPRTDPELHGGRLGGSGEAT